MNNMQLDVEVEKPLHVGSFGFKIIINCLIEFNDEVAPEIIIKKVTGEVVTRTAELDNAETGVVVYTFQPGDLTEPGTYSFQIRQVATNGNFAYRSAIVKLPVYPSLDISL